MMWQIKTLEKRFVLFLLVPVTVLLVIMGTVGFIYARKVMISQWEESAILRLQRSAHSVDMRLARPKDLVKFYLKSTGNENASAVRKAILSQLAKTPGVLKVAVIPVSAADDRQELVLPDSRSGHHGKMLGNRLLRGPDIVKHEELKITLPRYDADLANDTVSLMAKIVDQQGQLVELLNIIMDFKFLINDLPRSKGWDFQASFLVDGHGNILVDRDDSNRKMLGETGNLIEKMTLEAIQTKASATVRGPGYPPDEISGFYRLTEAPWYIVVLAPGREIFKSIIQFRDVYVITLTMFMLTILILIRRFVSRAARSVSQLSTAADQIAGGRFEAPLEITSTDEIGELIKSFNTMSSQLQERMRMKTSLNLAKEVQQNLIPAEDPQIEGLDIAGRSVFCDETGGDYYDYLKENGHNSQRIRIVIGDVAGHGVASALLMSGVRASFRQRNATSGSIEEVVTDVNSQVASDVGDSGRFMTLFCLEIDLKHRCAGWVRAGHEPGLLYHAQKDKFDYLKDGGIPLGVADNTNYAAHTCQKFQSGDLFILGTDGIWEAINPQGEMFGKKRLEEILRSHQNQDASSMIQCVYDRLIEFVGRKSLQDDATLIIVKIN